MDGSRHVASSLLLALAVLLFAAAAPAQETESDRPRVTGDRLGGFVLPIEPLAGNITFSATRANAWTVDDTKRLLLEGDVRIAIADHRFSTARAVVWLNRLPSAGGLINQVAVFFDEVDEPTAQAGLGVTGRNVLVTGSARGAVSLEATIVEPTRPSRSQLLTRAERRLADHLRALVEQGARLTRMPRVDMTREPDPFVPAPGGTVPERELADPPPAQPELIDPHPPLVTARGTVFVTAGLAEFVPGDDEHVLTLQRGVVLDYLDAHPDLDVKQISMSAQRAVVFLDPVPLDAADTWQLDAAHVRGVYLEGNVAVVVEDGTYTLRAPHAYYDFGTGQAIAVDAILRTTALDGRTVIYTRAEELRQISQNQWEARHARVSVSEFHTPHLALGAGRVTVTQRETESGDTRTHVDARNITTRFGDVPVMFWPAFSGDPERIPLRGIRVGTSNNNGLEIETRWDLFGLGGMDTPEGVNADLLIDAYTERFAMGVGIDFEYDFDWGEGAVDLYGMNDAGVDRTSSGRDVDPDQTTRGVALWEHTSDLGRDWTMQGQLSYISDDTFITTFREDDFRERREYETSLYFKHQRDTRAFTGLLKYEVNNFISNDWLLASRGYQVDRMPEIAFRQIGESLFGETLTYTGETRVTRMRFVFEENTPRELGIRRGAFGLDPDMRISDMLTASGLRTDHVMRVDSRHEVSMPRDVGPVRLVPFLVGRGTFYDSDFDEFSSDSGRNRFYGAMGLRASTQLHRIDNSVESRVLDLHRLRHVVEPNLLLWYGAADIDQADLPEYDAIVESLATGGMVKLGVTNRWQTYRGPPGLERSVDVFMLDSALVFSSGDVNRESPIPQFFDYRPEYSQGGDHVYNAMMWRPSDTLTFFGESTYDLERNDFARLSIGGQLQHSPLFATAVEYRRLDPGTTELLDVSWRYQISPKHEIILRPQWDFRREEFRSLTVRLVRRFPEFEFILQVKHDQIRNDTQFGASVGLVEF